MKKLMLTAGLCLSGMAFAQTGEVVKPEPKPLPTAPENCLESIQLKGYCSDSEASIFKGPIKVKFFIAIDKSAYPTVDAALERYFDFDKWPAYVATAGRTNIEFTASAKLASLPATDSNPEVLRQYANYRIAVPIIQWQDVRSLTFNYRVEPYAGALASAEFVVQNQGAQEVPEGEAPLEGSEGLKSQTGSVHAVDCSKSNLCNDDQYLLVYQSTISPDIDLFPSVAAGAILEGIETIIIGMFQASEEEEEGEIL